MSDSSPENFIRPRFGRHGPRSKKGCSTCRTRKVKCDERRPQCLRCAQSRVKCEWDLSPKPRRRLCQPSEALRGENALIQPSPSLVSIDSRDDEQDVEEIPYTSPSDRSLVLTQYATQTPLLQTLSTSHIPLSNSLNLETLDWECFQYIPRSFLVLGMGKPWRWSMLSYIHSKIATQEPGVMRAFIAVASMELRSKDLLPPDESGVQSIDSIRRARKLQYVGMNNYHLALNDLSSILERASRPDRTDDDLDALFAMWFLILTFEQYGLDLVENTHIHLTGIHSFISGVLEQGVHLDLPPASQQLLHFLCHFDANFALSNRRGGYLFHSLLTAPPSSGINREHLFEESRTCLPRIWGSDYPEEEILDDFENYRGLSLLQIAMKLKVEVWRLGVAVRQGTADRESIGRLWRKIENVEKDFFDVLSMARLARTSHKRRVVVTVYHAALEYYGARVLFACIPGSHLMQSATTSSTSTSTFQQPSRQNTSTSSFFPSSTPRQKQNQNQPTEGRPPWLDATLTILLAIAHKSLDTNPELIYRYIWPLCIAGVKTMDPIHRDWIAGQVKRAGVLLKNMGVPAQVLGGSTEWDVKGEGMLFLDEGGAGSVVGLLE